MCPSSAAHEDRGRLGRADLNEAARRRAVAQFSLYDRDTYLSLSLSLFLRLSLSVFLSLPHPLPLSDTMPRWSAPALHGPLSTCVSPCAHEQRLSIAAGSSSSRQRARPLSLSLSPSLSASPSLTLSASPSPSVRLHLQESLSLCLSLPLYAARPMRGAPAPSPLRRADAGQRRVHRVRCVGVASCGETRARVNRVASVARPRALVSLRHSGRLPNDPARV